MFRVLDLAQYFRWYARNRATRRHFFKDDRAGAYNRFFADRGPREHDGTHSNMRAKSDAHTPPKDGARRNMSMRIDSAIMLNDASGIDDAVFADRRAGVDDRSRHYNGSASNACRGRNDGA